MNEAGICNHTSYPKVKSRGGEGKSDKKRTDPIMKCNGCEGSMLKRETIGVRLADVCRRWKKAEEGREKGRSEREGGVVYRMLMEQRGE